MADVDKQEKTEQPTPKKLSDARKKGQVAKSMEINSLLVFSSGLMLLYFSQHNISEHFASFTIKIFSSLDTLQLNVQVVQQFMIEICLSVFFAFIPFFLGLVVISIIAGFAQVGFKLSPEALMPKMEKFNVINGIKKVLFSSKSLVELIKSLVKLIIVSLSVYLILSNTIIDTASLVTLSVGEIVKYMMEATFNLTWKLALIYSVLAAADFVYQKHSFKKDMMMTKEEIKEEHKQSEGDPHVKSRIRRIQIMMSKNRMMHDIPKADVVITNPTHFAVALKYEMTKDSAPKVVAKGVDALAQKIKEEAAKNNIPLYEDRELARALYKYCDIGDYVPEKLFKAVAQVLAYIYQLKNKKKKSIV